ncbi:ABC transporter permease subunit [Neptunicella marina]|uniref:ABC transporter permease subunit n=1 Tax=Neptunicella marina TaxID=2125989 RepID=A0A8J6IPN2_9ALTE|nr:ABC transporter permease subunit [Neptunicella marina]MBC3764821.1 ABC transporter permease subunit [Neptunicella marina]
MSSELTLSSNKSRKIKDKIARYGVTLGGLLVLAALLLIFFYLLYVVAPIFRSAEIHNQTSFNIPHQAQTLAIGVEEQVEIAYLFDDSSTARFFYVQTDNTKNQTAGQEIASIKLLDDHRVSTFAQSMAARKLYAYGFENGSALVVSPKFTTSFPNNIRHISADINYVTGQTPVEMDTQGHALTQLAVEKNMDSLYLVAATDDNRLLINSLSSEENFMTGEIEWSSDITEIEAIPHPISQIRLSSNLAYMFVLSGNHLFIYNIRDLTDISLIQDMDVNADDASVTTMSLLSGASSIMIGNDNGIISQWFEIRTEAGRQFVKAREFDNQHSVSQIVPEFYRKSFFTLSNDATVGIYFTTSDAELFNDRIQQGSIEHMSVAPRSNALLTQTDDSFHLFKVDNEHPEVTWKALWQKVWYEGYPEPDYVWQSTSADDEFESKFSLVPISFGTIKAAFYAMLFAVPIALAAAIYTAYFMSPGMRQTVKPTIEIMEALPTVILGFLAGLWLAPVIENNLPGVLMFLLLTPVGIVTAAYVWTFTPEKIRLSFRDGWDAVLLIPVVLVCAYISFALSPELEIWFFDGDTRAFLTNELGIGFDQRNSLVVGIAMGFAVIPTIFSIAEDAIFSVPKQLSNGSLALGATPWQTLTRVVLLTASPGIFSAVMMGLGRAVGETMIVLMATGNTPIMDWNIFEGMRTLSANIAVEMPESEVGSSHYRILFLAAFVLFIFTFLFNTVAEFVRQRLREKYSDL